MGTTKRVRLDENGHPKVERPKANKDGQTPLRKKVVELERENASLLSDIGSLTKEFMNLVAYKDQLERSKSSAKPSPLALFALFASMLSKTHGVSKDEMKKVVEAL